MAISCLALEEISRTLNADIPCMKSINSELRYWLALNRTPGVGAVTFRNLLEKVHTPREIFIQNRQGLLSLGLNDNTIKYLLDPDWHSVEEDLKWQEPPNRQVLTLNSTEYPLLLKEIPDPPPVLFVHGNPLFLSVPQIAIVGSRNPSSSGRKHANDFAYRLASVGLGITSGLALGIDKESHVGALNNNGITIAVAGNGLDVVYPARHRDLAHQIAEQGALISEFPPGTPPSANNFPRRNRIISGLCLGTLVVEAALNSGSLITAKYAMEQGREVFASPGSILNPLSRGCHKLIKEGAKLVEDVNDILEEINIMADVQSTPMTIETNPDLEKDHEKLLKNIAYDPTPVDTLVELTGESPASIASMLLVLELKGYISSEAGGCYYRIK